MTRFLRTILITLVASAAVSALSIVDRAGGHEDDPENIVYVTDSHKYCMMMPRKEHTRIGDSEHKGGMKTYCSPEGRFSPKQGQLPPDFWKDVEFKAGNGTHDGRFVQLTGCIRSEKLSRLDTKDSGGQYDSSGNGHPKGGKCLGFKHYVELIEPDANRACIKCCDHHEDCPTDKNRQGCREAIPGNYFGC